MTRKKARARMQQDLGEHQKRQQVEVVERHTSAETRRMRMECRALLSKVLGLLSCAELARCASVCRAWHSQKATVARLVVPKSAFFERAVEKCVAKRLLSITAHKPNLLNLTLPYLPSLRNLCMGGSTLLTNLAGLASCPSLRILDLSGCSFVTHIAPISACPHLVCATFSACEALESLEGIEWCSALSKLFIPGCRALTTLHPLEGLQSLAFLDAQGCFQLRDVSALESCPKLTEVSLQHCINLPCARFSNGQLHTLNAIHCPMLQLDVSGCAALRKLHANQSSWLTGLCDFPAHLNMAFFSWCFSLTNVDAVNGWQNLQILDLEDCTQLKRFNVSSLPLLRELILSGCTALEEAPFLGSFKRLRELHMANCTALQNVDLAGCENLLVLDITARKAADFPVLPTANRIAQMDWSFSGALSLAPLAACAQLETLLLESSMVCDFTPLAKCTELRTLDVSRNWIVESLGPLQACTKLERLVADLCPNLQECPVFKRFAQRQVAR